MNLNQQVVSLELAKRLKELGIKQESYFYWYELIGMDSFRLRNKDWLPEISGEMPYSAFTFPEILHLMPKLEQLGFFYFYDEGGDYQCSYYLIEHSEKDNKAADCLARMLIYVIENKLMEMPK